MDMSGKCGNKWAEMNPKTQGPSLKEILEEEIARIDGYNVLPDYQLEKIADLVISKIGRAISKDFGK